MGEAMNGPKEVEAAFFLDEIGRAWGPGWQAALEREIREGTLIYCGWVDEDPSLAGPPSPAGHTNQLDLFSRTCVW